MTTLGAIGEGEKRIIAPPVAALWRPPGPPTPSIAAVPKRSGLPGETPLQRVEMKVGMMAADPGQDAQEEPSTVPRAMGAADISNPPRGQEPLDARLEDLLRHARSILRSTSLTRRPP